MGDQKPASPPGEDDLGPDLLKYPRARLRLRVRFPPPSPLSPGGRDLPREVRLPWATAGLTCLAGAIAGPLAAVIVCAVMYGGVSVALAEFVPNAITPAFRGLLMGLGAAVADRLMSRTPRPVRWALGMCVASLVPPQIPSIVFGGSGRTALRTPMDMGTFALDGAVTGLFIGFAVPSARGLWWRVPLAGLVARVLGGLSRAPNPVPWIVFGVSSFPLGMTVPDQAIAESLFGILLGVAIAACLTVALADSRVAPEASDAPL